MPDTPLEEHLRRLVRTWLGLPGAVRDVPRLPGRLAQRLLRDGAGTTRTAEIDEWAAEQRRVLERTIELEPLWPQGHPFVICLTHDVDLVSASFTAVQALRYVRAGVDRSAMGVVRPLVRTLRALRAGISRAPDTGAYLDDCAAIEREYDVTATYFFAAPPTRPHRFDCWYGPDDACTFRGRRVRVADVMTALASDGHDVGLHGSLLSATEPQLLDAQRGALADATGLEITSTRQHFLRWQEQRTPRLQAAAGLRVDSTLGSNDDVGYRSGTSLPFWLFDDEAQRPLHLLEVPLVAQDTALLRDDTLRLDVERARDLLRDLADRCRSASGVMTALFHPNGIAQEDARRLFRWTIEYGLEHGAWFATLRDVDVWWRRRAARLGVAA